MNPGSEISVRAYIAFEGKYLQHCACILYPPHPLTTLCFYSWLGELSQNPGDKKSERDFALWKASKPGEPAWDSPWGKVTIANNEDFL